MVPASIEEPVANIMEKSISSQLFIYPINAYHLTYIELWELF